MSNPIELLESDEIHCFSSYQYLLFVDFIQGQIEPVQIDLRFIRNYLKKLRINCRISLDRNRLDFLTFQIQDYGNGKLGIDEYNRTLFISNDIREIIKKIKEII
jgi:hypothetical protein